MEKVTSYLDGGVTKEWYMFIGKYGVNAVVKDIRPRFQASGVVII